jgi:hypothetical protein
VLSNLKFERILLAFINHVRLKINFVHEDLFIFLKCITTMRKTRSISSLLLQLQINLDFFTLGN